MSPSVEPFDEAKYKALMDGLDFLEINKSELENEFTIGAEYYGKKYVHFMYTNMFLILLVYKLIEYVQFLYKLI